MFQSLHVLLWSLTGGKGPADRLLRESVAVPLPEIVLKATNQGRDWAARHGPGLAGQSRNESESDGKTAIEVRY